VVLNTDGAVQMPWLKSVGSVLEMWYPGQEGGSATADVLLGTYDPAGKLPLTFPTGNDATPFAGHPERAVGVNGAITWSEDMQMGYRWYDANAVAPLFPFGFGLSYTSFEYSRLSVTADRHDGGFDVAFSVQNTGSKAGSDVPQVYVGPASSVPADVQQVPKKLLQFARVNLRPRQSTQVRVHVAPRDLSNWSTSAQGWVLGAGDRAVYVAASATDIRLTGLAKVVAHK
jgi:beta-glucosidase